MNLCCEPTVWVQNNMPFALLPCLMCETANLHHIGRLRVPESFVAQKPVENKAQTRYGVAWHHHMLNGVTQLRQELTMPPRALGGGTGGKKGIPVVFVVEGTKSEPKPYHEERMGTMLLQSPQTQEKPSVPVSPDVHEKRALALVTKPLMHATKITAIQAR